MISFKSFLEAENAGGGQAAGKLELVKTPVKKAREYGEKVAEKFGRDFDKELPNFNQAYIKVQKLANKHGKTKRKDMPVIADNQVREFQQRLKDGFLDVDRPFSDKTNPKNPFPEGLSGKEAEHFVEAGLKIHDGDADDDKVKASIKQVKVSDLKPIQKQIYVDKSLDGTLEYGAKGTKDFLQSSPFVASSDLFIVDGHHRWLSGNLVDPDMKVPVLVIDLPMKDLLPLSTAYGDAIGNKRNQ